jgi:hypothetical protein
MTEPLNQRIEPTGGSRFSRCECAANRPPLAHSSALFRPRGVEILFSNRRFRESSKSK